jgi:hypothetical protein
MTIEEVESQKIKLEQKKARVSMEETKLKIKERKMRTRALIEKGGLITKAGLEHLPSNALYGGLLSLKKDLDANENLLSSWIVHGNAAFNSETKNSIPVILKFDDEPSSDIRTFIRSHGLRFNRFRQEWYGNTTTLDELRESLGKIKYDLEIIENLN